LFSSWASSGSLAHRNEYPSTSTASSGDPSYLLGHQGDGVTDGLLVFDPAFGAMVAVV
jgi:hypothetical protein